MGIAGAAVATVTRQIIAMVIAFTLNRHFNREVRVQFRGFRPSGKMLFYIYRIGVPSMLTIGIGSVMTFMMNKLMMAIEATATAAAVFGAYFKIQSIFNLPVVGLSHGMNPIIGYNLGNKNKKRMIKTYKLTIMYAMVYMLIGAIAFFFVPDLLLGIFKPSQLMLKIGVPAFRIIAVSFLFSAYTVVVSQFFMATGMSIPALILSVAHQLLLLIPIAYLLGYTLGYEYVWYAIPISGFGAVIVAVIGRIHMQKTVLKKLPN